jgi:uncharacterized protein YggE
MKKSVSFVIFCLFMLCSLTGQAKEAAANAAVSTVTVQGSAQLDVPPDLAVLTVGIMTVGETAADTRQENAVISASIQQKIAELGINSDKMQTGQYTVSPIYSNSTDKTAAKPPAIIGYRITNTVKISVDDLTMLGAVVDTALTAGANQISGIHFYKKNDLALKQAVLQEAVREAIAKADAIAVALGKRLGQPLTINEGGVYIQSPENPRLLLKADTSAATPITPGVIQLNGSVNISFELL